jgi:ribosomal protein S18 acetylase RimI-like enzyme
MEIRTYRDGDGDRLRTFWLTCGIKIRPGDDDASLARFAAQNGHLVGSALAGWDGRRGWLYHVAVHRDERRRGIGRTLVADIERRLRELGCPKLNLIVWDDNTWAMQFWEALGYRREKTVEFAKEL